MVYFLNFFTSASHEELKKSLFNLKVLGKSVGG